MRKTGADFPGTELSDEPSEKGQASDLDAMPADKRAALEAVAKKHGFKDLQEWTDVANSVVMSYVYAAQGKKPGSVEEAVRMNVLRPSRIQTSRRNSGSKPSRSTARSAKRFNASSRRKKITPSSSR